MVVALWRGCNRCWACISVQTLRCGTSCILRYRLVAHLLRDGALRFALGERCHRRARGTGRDRRLALFVATAKADVRQPLQERQPGLLRMLVLGVAAGLPDFGLL